MSTNNVVFLCCGLVGMSLLCVDLLSWPANFWTQTDRQNWVVLISLILAAVLLPVGCAAYVRGKGYTTWLGLLGLIAPIGIVILAALDNREQTA